MCWQSWKVPKLSWPESLRPERKTHWHADLDPTRSIIQRSILQHKIGEAADGSSKNDTWLAIPWIFLHDHPHDWAAWSAKAKINTCKDVCTCRKATLLHGLNLQVQKQSRETATSSSNLTSILGKCRDHMIRSASPIILSSGPCPYNIRSSAPQNPGPWPFDGYEICMHFRQKLETSPSTIQVFYPQTSHTKSKTI